MSHNFAHSSGPAGLEGSHKLARFNGPSGGLLLAAAGEVTSDPQARTITGRLVPYGQVGNAAMGPFTFGPGSISIPADHSEVKLLVEHSQRESVGYAVRLWEEADGLYGTFHLPPGDPEADLALARAASKVRNAFSVGVELDAGSLEAARRHRGGAPIKGRGALRETSLVSVPAFQGARVTDVAASSSHLVVAAWSDQTPNPSDERTPGMFCTHCGQANGSHLPTCATFAAAPSTGPAATAPVGQGQAQLQAGGQLPAGVDQAQLQAALLGLLGVPPEQANATSPETPAVVPAAAGAAHLLASGGTGTQVVSEPPTYTFDGQGHGFIRDAWSARQDGNVEASARLARFAQELSQGGPVVDRILEASHPELARFAVETRATEPNLMSPNAMRGDQLVRALDVTRPMMSKLRSIRLTDATPFKVPTEGEFSAVGDHTEGQAHVAEGDLSLGAVTISPTAISGAYRFSRELADASNPAIDSIAIRAMTRDYARKSEAKAAAALALQSDGVTAATRVLSIDTPAELRAEIINYAVANGTVPPDFALMGSGFFTTHATAVAGDGRPYFPPLNPTNAAGTSNARTLSINVDGVEGFLAAVTVPAEAYLVRAEDVLVGESPLLTFRFEQPEGPGIIKVALWGYVVARTLRNTGVRRLTTAAA